MVPARPFFIGSDAWARSKACTDDFSSIHSTTALSGGLRYRPTTSMSFSSNLGSFESLKVLTRCGFNHCRPARLTNRDRPRFMSQFPKAIRRCRLPNRVLAPHRAAGRGRCRPLAGPHLATWPGRLAWRRPSALAGGIPRNPRPRAGASFDCRLIMEVLSHTNTNRRTTARQAVDELRLEAVRDSLVSCGQAARHRGNGHHERVVL